MDSSNRALDYGWICDLYDLFKEINLCIFALEIIKNPGMKFGVVIFPGSNCDRDMINALRHDLQQEVISLWHKDKDLSIFNIQDCIVLPGGFSYGDYLR